MSGRDINEGNQSEVTSFKRGAPRWFGWRPLIHRLREDFWSAAAAPSLLLGINPDLTEGDRLCDEGWRIVWLTGAPPGRYATLDRYSLEMNLADDLAGLHEALRAGGPEGYTPAEWITWASRRGYPPPWHEQADWYLSTERHRETRQDRRESRFAKAGKARYAKTKYPSIKAAVWDRLELAKGLEKRGRRAEFDRQVSDDYEIPERLAGNWRREWELLRKRAG